MRGLAGKRAIVTGGAGGIGLAIAQRLLQEGGRVILMDRDGERAEQRVESLRQQGFDAIAKAADVADESAVRATMAFCEDRFGGLDILVNNAALLLFEGVNAQRSDWERVLAVNVTGAALCVKHAVPLMHQGGGGVIINIGSISGVIAQPGYLTYSATKGPCPA